MQGDKKDDKYQDKILDPSNALERVLRLDRKHSNFELHDNLLNTHFRVAYQKAEEPLPGDHLLKHFWKHAENYYFKKIDEPELDRLRYIETLFNSETSSTSFETVGQIMLEASPQFWELLESSLNSTFFKTNGKSEQNRLHLKNHLSLMYAQYLSLQNQDRKGERKNKINQSRLRDARQTLIESNEPFKKRKILESLKREEKLLEKSLPYIRPQPSEVDKQLIMLQEELLGVNSSNQQIFQTLEKRVQSQINQREILYICSQQVDAQEMDEFLSKKKCKPFLKHINDLNNVDYQLNYIRYEISQLQRKQIAESISKVTKVIRTRGLTRFAVAFQPALNLRIRLMTEEELMGFNKHRQFSVFKYHLMSLKSHYSMNSQNVAFHLIQFAGFRHTYYHHDEPCKFFLKEEKQLLDLAKRSFVDPYDESTMAFENFDICHHCRQFYSNDFLEECKYNSSVSCAPAKPSTYFNPYLMQVSKAEGTGNGVSSNSQRFSTRKRNLLFSYCKKDDEYCCQRKFCKYCLKKTYQDGFDKNGLCPFCQGFCFCTRCSRNQTIVKLKSIYHLYGGNMAELNKQSEYDKLRNLEEDQDPALKKGRPRKIKLVVRKSQNIVSFFKNTTKLKDLRYELEDARILCDLVKRREKKKKKIMQGQSQIFHKKIPMIAKYYLSNKRSHSCADTKENDDPQVFQTSKARKRVHRQVNQRKSN